MGYEDERINDTQLDNPRMTYTVTLDTLNGTNIAGLRGILKALGRRYGFRCRDVQREKTIDTPKPTTDTPGAVKGRAGGGGVNIYNSETQYRNDQSHLHHHEIDNRGI